MKVIGHRGAAGHAPENTLISIETALKQCVSGIEIDVQLTKDGQLVIIHDFTVNRTTNGIGEINSLTLNEIRNLDAGSSFNPQFKGELVPTLDEVLEIIPKDKILNIELKHITYKRKNLEQKVIETLTRYDRIENIIVSSFDHSSLLLVNQINPNIKTGLLTCSHLLDPWNYIQENKLNIYSIHPSYEFVTKEYVSKIQEKGYKVYCYTVNDEETGDTLDKMGVDGIITDYPDKFIKK
jgi:glycerophosphoryl diester phosphodiesterase